jgi:large subunit ribosomal protein L2
MGVRTFKPYTASRRHMTGHDFAELTEKSAGRPLKKLTQSKDPGGARNNYGRISVRFHGGGHKKRYRVIDFKRNKTDVPAKVVSIEYDPNRSARIALLSYKDGDKRYILAPVGLTKGDMVIASDTADIKPANCMPLAKMPVGTTIHNVEVKPGKGGQLVRSAGVGAQLMAKEAGYALVRLPSGEIRRVLETCRASVGQVGNLDHENITLGKAGRSRWLGKMPHNRGVSMNPVDHPLGGGEGKTSGGRNPVTPWGQPTRGYKTRNNKKTDRFITQRRPKGKKS